MLVALISDVHDHTSHLLAALATAEASGCTHLLFMGDLTSLSTMRTLREQWQHPIDLVFGNNEFDHDSHLRLARNLKDTVHHGYHADINLCGRRIFFCHYPHEAVKAANRGLYDAVFFGHTHVAEQYHCNNTLLANPGEIYGRQAKPSFAVYDTENNTVRTIPC